MTVNIGFPVSQLVCILWVDSVNAAVDHLIITSTVIMAIIKGLNVLAKKKTFVELLRLMKELDATVTTEEYECVFKRKFLVSDGLLLLFCANYIGSWSCVAIQVIMSHPANRLWSSTYLYPSEFLHQCGIYLGGIIFQAISNLLLVFVDIVVDTYGASLLHILGGHIEILSQHLQALGKGCNNIEEFRQQEPILIELCKKYLLIIRYSKSLEKILSFALFSQFGVSGLVLCTCAYQLSVVSPMEDTYKFLFSAVYSFAMITEIFIPSYFGSAVYIKSQKLCYDTFTSNWLPASVKYKRSMQILVERTLQPISIYAASVFLLNLTTLLKILKTAYSIFAMLKNTQT
ncbi:odorant receptor 33a-like [Sitodiplosis mosellana]|uniref:odorant receptor 33a-like n=1 Tax=Sitodiplosis mosellana TaxID=263140 RepID=UPI002444CC18|nr:odorant receptor 33a-like [Sitodiplosis mosellana]